MPASVSEYVGIDKENSIRKRNALKNEFCIAFALINKNGILMLERYMYVQIRISICK